MEDVRQGLRGNITRVLQAFLYINGFNPDPFDGVFGNGTDRAVKDYQRTNRLQLMEFSVLKHGVSCFRLIG
ncbi:peptidoglycan-binding domain-containing protein [Alkalihalobacillus trypoxylicola]|uniref:Peptidoglycan binding-like domain-containing protein n=1 Tax=Alkalihalobacillus trypoxylicola TaxID=519424 RepID=A0A161QL00_9BACI|nr:hypothetical protein AZF04_18820 [Alkalihalobacillus trypoxylicola]